MWDKLKNALGIGEEDDLGEYETDDMPFVSGGRAPAEESAEMGVPKRNKVVNINATTQLQVVLVKPERFDDASSIADHLNAKRTVVLNLENTKIGRAHV